MTTQGTPTTAGLNEEFVDEDDDAEMTPAVPAWRGPSLRRWVVFGALAIAIVALDQIAKAWVIANLVEGRDATNIIGTYLRVVHGRNSGILFGMLPQSGGAFAIVSLVVIGGIMAYHWKSGRGIVTTIALGLLLGGAIGNLLDRLRYGAVVDWIDMGIGSARFWTYNIGDAAITTSIILIIVTAFFPVVASWGTDD
jgi:lipoprotein signal peptidase